MEESQRSLQLQLTSSKDIPYNSSYDGENFYRGIAAVEKERSKKTHFSSQRDRPLKQN